MASQTQIKRYFITGITGTLGQAVAKRLLDRPDVHVVGFSRDELKQSLIEPNERLTLYLGDVRDRDRVIEATRGIDAVLHFASLKRVDSLEENPEEAVRTIIEGTTNILHAQRINKIPRVTLTSTDKAVYPVNVYGACKFVAERLVLRNSNNVVCRYGNVLGSRGSVVHAFADSIEKEGKIYVTHRLMSRFWIPIEKAAEFVLKSAHEDRGGLKIPDMKASNVVALGLAVATALDKQKPDIEVIGMRPGEKLTECLMTVEEGAQKNYYSNAVEQFTQKDLTEMAVALLGGTK